jgi:hypothetical protein
MMEPTPPRQQQFHTLSESAAAIDVKMWIVESILYNSTEIAF